MKNVVCIFFAALLLLCACGENIEESAGRYLEKADAQFRVGDYNGAKQQIDSIRLLYPKAIETRRAALRLMQRIEEAEQLRTIAFEDSLLKEMQKTFQDLKSRYMFEKDEKYQDLGLFFAPSQALENNIGRDYLRGQVDETGRMTVVSNFSGTAYIHHRSVKVTDGDTFVESPATDDFYEFKDMDRCFERCNLKSGEDGGLAAYIAQNRDKRLIVTLIGNRNITLEMTTADRKSIGGLYDLSMLLLGIEEHKAILAEAQRKLMFVRHNKEKADSAAVTR